MDVIKGLAQMMGMKSLEIPGVTDGMDNDFAGQVNGAMASLAENDLVVISGSLFTVGEARTFLIGQGIIPPG